MAFDKTFSQKYPLTVISKAYNMWSLESVQVSMTLKCAAMVFDVLVLVIKANISMVRFTKYLRLLVVASGDPKRVSTESIILG